MWSESLEKGIYGSIVRDMDVTTHFWLFYLQFLSNEVDSFNQAQFDSINSQLFSTDLSNIVW